MRLDLLGSIQKCRCKAHAYPYLITYIPRSRHLKLKPSRGFLLILTFFQAFISELPSFLVPNLHLVLVF